MGKRPGLVGMSQRAKENLIQVNTNNSAYSETSTVVSNQGAHCEAASSWQIPSVSFDLGNEWDDWGDFDDENLVHASEASFPSTSANAKPQIQQSVEFNVPGNMLLGFLSFLLSHVSLSFIYVFVGFGATSAPVLMDHSVKTCITTPTTPVR